jgi:hypothetical protein
VERSVKATSMMGYYTICVKCPRIHALILCKG